MAAATGPIRREPRWRRFLRRPAGVVAGAWLLLVVIGAVFAPLLAPFDPKAQDLANALSGPSSLHPLGTDPLGRDVLSQLIYGARPALLGVACALVTFLLIGVAFGIIAGYAGGPADSAISRATDLLLSLPALVMLLVVFAVFPDSFAFPMAILGAIASAGLIRVVRSVTLAIREDLYIRSARVFGLSHTRIVIRHVLPRISGTVIVQASLFAALALQALSGLSLLGFGVVLPEPSWGGLLGQAFEVMSRSAWLLVPAGGIIGVTVLALVFFGSAARDVWTEAWAPSRLSAGPTKQQKALPVAKEVREGAAVRPGGVVSDPGSYADDVVLAVEHLSVEFAGRPAPRPVISDVSFTVSKGETLAVVGESGCGKSIMALAVLGLLPAGGRRTAGHVLLDGVDLSAVSRREMAAIRGRGIGYVAQDPMVSLDPTFTVGAQIVEAIRANSQVSKADARRKVVELLDSVNLPEPAEVARRYPHQLSGGMLQRCVIALALSGDPDLLIADEPTTALDVTVQAEIIGLLRNLQQQRRMAVLLITHNWDVVTQAADRAMVMYAGEVAEISDVTHLLDRPSHPYARALLASEPMRATPGQPLPVIPGAVPAPGSWPAWCRFEPRCPEAEAVCRTGSIPLFPTAPGHQARCVHARPAEEVQA